MNAQVSFWLLPCEPEEKRLREIIGQLAARFSGPVFRPHATLYSGPLDSRDRPAELVARLAREVRPLELRVTGISFSSRFTKTLFIEFAPSGELAALSGWLRNDCVQPSDYLLKPHLSLVYAGIDDGMKLRLSREIAAPPMIPFDRLAAIVAPGITRTRADVEAWRLVAEERLA